MSSRLPARGVPAASDPVRRLQPPPAPASHHGRNGSPARRGPALRLRLTGLRLGRFRAERLGPVPGRRRDADGRHDRGRLQGGRAGPRASRSTARSWTGARPTTPNSPCPPPAAGASDVAAMHLSRLAGYAPGGLVDAFDLDLLAEFGVTRKDFTPAVWARTQHDGTVYAIPLDVHPFIVFYDKEAADTAGLLDSLGELAPMGLARGAAVTRARPSPRRPGSPASSSATSPTRHRTGGCSPASTRRPVPSSPCRTGDPRRSTSTPPYAS